MNKTNNTVKYGLESTTASMLIGILNETYPYMTVRAVDGSCGNDDNDYNSDIGVEVYVSCTSGSSKVSGGNSGKWSESANPEWTLQTVSTVPLK